MRVGLVLLAVASLLAFPTLSNADSWDNWRYAVKYGQDAEVVRMLDSGQDINVQNEEGWTALHVAAEDGNERMVRYLLARGARTDIKTRTGRTAYDVSEGYSSIRSLIRAKMGPPNDPFAPFLGGGGAAAQPQAPAPRPEARAPAANGACALANAAPANDGRTASTRPRLQARDHVWYNQPGELTALLDDCVAIDSKDTGGSTLLHVAAERDRVDIARLLVGRGASRSVTDASGKRPADYATSPEMKALLGAPSAAQAPAANGNEAYCKNMWHEATALCGRSNTSCNISASNQYSGCLRRGTWY